MPVIPELRQVGEGWMREDQKFKAFLNYKASGRALGLLETLLKTNKNCRRLSLGAYGLVGGLKESATLQVLGL